MKQGKLLVLNQQTVHCHVQQVSWRIGCDWKVEQGRCKPVEMCKNRQLQQVGGRTGYDRMFNKVIRIRVKHLLAELVIKEE